MKLIAFKVEWNDTDWHIKEATVSLDDSEDEPAIEISQPDGDCVLVPLCAARDLARAILALVGDE